MVTSTLSHYSQVTGKYTYFLLFYLLSTHMHKINLVAPVVYETLTAKRLTLQPAFTCSELSMEALE